MESRTDLPKENEYQFQCISYIYSIVCYGLPEMSAQTFLKSEPTQKFIRILYLLKSLEW